MGRKKENTNKVVQSTVPVSMKPSSTDDFPLVYSEDIWDVVANNSNLKNIVGNYGQYDQHSINESLASSVASATQIAYHYDTTESVFDPTTNKGIQTANNVYVKVPSYYYTKFDNTEIIDGQVVPITPPAHSITIPITNCGNCPIVQIVQDGHVVYCDTDINVGTGVITITWGNTITVDVSHPLYISIVG